MSFWGATATSSKPFEESVPTNANLVVSHVSLAGPTDGVTTLMCTVDGIDGEFVVAHLTWNRTEQASVDLVYPLGSDVKFTVKGKGEVHLLGMYDPVDDMNMGYGSSDDEEGMMFGSEDSDLEGEDEEDSDEALRMQYGTGRGPKITELPEGSDEDEDSDEDEGVAVPVQQPKKQGGQQGQKQGQQQKQGGQQGQKQGGQQGQKQGQQQKQGGQQGQKQGGQQQGNNQGQKRKAQDSPNQPQQKKQKTGQSPNNQQKRK